MLRYRTMSNAACMRSPYKYTSSQIFPTMICAASPGKQLSLIFWYKQWSAVIVKYRMVVKVFQIFPKKLDLVLLYFVSILYLVHIHLGNLEYVRLFDWVPQIQTFARMIKQAIALRVKSQLFFLLRKNLNSMWYCCKVNPSPMMCPWTFRFGWCVPWPRRQTICLYLYVLWILYHCAITVLSESKFPKPYLLHHLVR
jgi:hypothetical protein